MHWFSKAFKEGVETHCVGATIVSVEANGTMEAEQNLILELDNGLFCTFNRGQGGLDGETFYEIRIGPERGSAAGDILNKSTWDPSGFTNLNESISFSTNEPVYREGMQGLVGKKILRPLLNSQIGLEFSDGDIVLVTELSMGILSAGFLLKRDGDKYTAVGKCITNFWSQCKSLYPGFLNDHLVSGDEIC